LRKIILRKIILAHQAAPDFSASACDHSANPLC
jgi:hypothetical protein